MANLEFGIWNWEFGDEIAMTRSEGHPRTPNSKFQIPNSKVLPLHDSHHLFRRRLAGKGGELAFSEQGPHPLRRHRVLLNDAGGCPIDGHAPNLLVDQQQL